jgi:tripartite-type tricarboxylate transporter receptor subunit TctC
MMKIIAAAILALVCSAALAQSYPTKAVRFLVPFPAGGAADIMSRIAGKRMSEGLGQPVVIQTQAGGGGAIATEALARSAPDGYTIALNSVSTLVLQPLLNPNVRYDPLKSFSHVGMMATAALVLFVNASVPANNLRQLIEFARAKPGQLNYGSNGVGAVPHLSMELLQSLAGIQMVHVPYKGAGPVTSALLGGEIQLAFVVPAGQDAYLQSGKLRALVVPTPKRLPSLPEVPTSAEAGLPEFQTYVWFGVSTPQGTPASVVARLNAEISRLLADREIQETFTKHGLEAAGSTPEEFNRFVATETAKWSKIIKSGAIKVEN